MGLPERDELGRKLEEGDTATLFSKHGTNFTGKIVMREGERCLEICEGSWLKGIGNLRIMKDRAWKT